MPKNGQKLAEVMVMLSFFVHLLTHPSLDKKGTQKRSNWSKINICIHVQVYNNTKIHILWPKNLHFPKNCGIFAHKTYKIQHKWQKSSLY